MVDIKGESSRLNLEAAPWAGAGTWPLTIRGTSPLAASQSTVLALTLAPLPVGFVLSVSPDTLVLAQRRSGAATVNVASRIDRINRIKGGVMLHSPGVGQGLLFYAGATLGDRSQ